MERNRRIAKAYVRVPLLTVNGSQTGFDGYKIGLLGFDNPLEDQLIKRVKHSIGKGVRIKIDEMGNVIIKRLSSADVLIRGYERDFCALGKDVVEANGNLPADTSIKLFDIKKFQQNITKELRNTYPNRQKLEQQCIIVIGFVRDTDNILDLPVWVMLINILALDMLKSRLPAVLYRNNEFTNYAGQQGPKFVSVFDKNEGQLRQQMVEDAEDPYSVPSLPKLMSENNQGSGASNSSGSGHLRNDPYSSNHHHANGNPINDIYSSRVMAQHQPSQHHHLQFMQQQHHRQRLLQQQQHASKNQREKENNQPQSELPPELPPRDFSGKQNGTPKKTKTRNFAKVFRFRKSSSNERKKKVSSDEDNHNHKPSDSNTTNEIEYEDPYYLGMQARVSNFGTRQRKSLAVTQQAPVQGYINNLNNAQYMRKANSNGYLNSLFNSSGSNFYPNSKASYYSPQYDSSFESDPYAISSNENADYYAIYGRMHHQNGYPAYRRNVAENYHPMPQTHVFSKADRYITDYNGQWEDVNR